MITTWLRLGALTCLAVSGLLACGGGGGGGSGESDSPLSIDGSATEAGSGGGVGPAPSGRTVALLRVENGGASRTTLAATTTDDAGRFRIELPKGSQFGWSLVIELAHPDGARSRTLALDSQADVGPASEALFRLLVENAGTAAAPNEPVARLARFQRAIVTFLNLLEPKSKTSSKLVSELQHWLRADPASADALRQLRNAGRLPSTFGDIGGMFGLGRSAWTAKNSAGVTRTFVVRQTDSDPNIYESFDELPPGAPGESPFLSRTVGSRVALVDDLVSVRKEYVPPDASVLEGAIIDAFSSYRLARYGEQVGAVKHTTYLPRKTLRVSFDPDGIEDDISREIDATVRGVEVISAFGSNVKALRTDYAIKSTIQLSGGGSIEIMENRTDWSVPFAGIVRTASNFDITDAAGRKSRGSSESWLEQGVLNDVSWPGRVLVQRVEPVPIPSLFREETTALASTPGGRIIFIKKDTTSGYYVTMYLVDAQTAEVLTERALPTGGNWFLVSPDGTKLYFTRGGPYPMLNSFLYSQPLVDADAAGALVVRFDAETLIEEMRITLPAHPSVLFPGQGYPRRSVGTMAISSTDANQVLLSTDAGVLLLRGDVIAPLTTATSMPESLSVNQGRLDAGTMSLLAFDGARGEAYARYYPLSSFIAFQDIALPITPDGPLLSPTRPGVAVGLPRGNDAIVGNRLYLLDFSYVFDVPSGTRLGQSPFPRPEVIDSTPYKTQCVLESPHVICLYNGVLHRLRENDLSTERVIDFQVRLRRLSGSQQFSGGSLMKLGAGDYAAARAPSFGTFGEKGVIERIRM